MAEGFDMRDEGGGRWRSLLPPLLVAALVVIPRALLVARATSETGGAWVNVYGHALSPEALQVWVAAGKAALLLPALLVAFAWSRHLYGPAAGWLALVLLLFEPTLTAMTPLATPDTLAVEAALIVCWGAWRMLWEGRDAPLVQEPQCLAAPLAGRGDGETRPASGAAKRQSFWARTLLAAFGSLLLAWLLIPRGPAGEQMLLGGYATHGWWYYYPVVALYKVPFGLWVIGLLGLMSFARRGLRRDELGLLIPAAVFGLWLLASPLDDGFRRALPCEVLLIVLASRCVATGAGRLWKLSAWMAAAWAAVGVSLWHPNYLPYLNHDWLNPQLEISDSNLDWGQSLPQVRDWLDKRPNHPTPVYLLYYGNPSAVAHYLGGRVHLLAPGEPVPREGLLIGSPVEVAGTFGVRRGIVELWAEPPIATIGRTMLVYDLSAITWRPQAKSHPKQPASFRWPIAPGDRGVRGEARDLSWLVPIAPKN